MSEAVTRHLRIFGRVQGVWYRESMRQEAERLGVTGWVRNRLDGSVEAALQGETGNVEILIKWARRGPPQALVTHIDIDSTPPTLGSVRQFSSFLKLASG